MQQLVIRVHDEMAQAIDDLVATGEFATRSDVIRGAVDALVDRRRRDEIGRQIVEGYERVPETDAEMAQAHESARAAIEAEPW